MLSPESLRETVCFMKFTLTRAREIKFAPRTARQNLPSGRGWDVFELVECTEATEEKIERATRVLFDNTIGKREPLGFRLDHASGVILVCRAVSLFMLG